MSRIAARFANLAKNRRKALIPYVTAGYPFKSTLPPKSNSPAYNLVWYQMQEVLNKLDELINARRR